MINGRKQLAISKVTGRNDYNKFVNFYDNKIGLIQSHFTNQCCFPFDIIIHVFLCNIGLTFFYFFQKYRAEVNRENMTTNAFPSTKISSFNSRTHVSLQILTLDEKFKLASHRGCKSLDFLTGNITRKI